VSEWDAFCETLRRAGAALLEPEAPEDPRERAAALEYLLGLVSAGARIATGLSDPDRPRFLRNPDSHSRWGAENADNGYLWTRIRPDAVYRISGERGSAFDFLIEVKEGYMQLGHDRNFATLTAADLEIGPDGLFEVILAAERPAGQDSVRASWLPLDPDARYVAIRQFFLDWENETPARFRIEREGDAGEPPPFESAGAARRLEEAGAWIEGTARFFGEWVPRLREQHRAGVILPARKFAGGADDIWYGNDLYRLADDEALIVETELPDARYWSFQLCDLWFRSADYANRQTSINASQAWLDRDGRFRCVVAHRDPGVGNWLDTAGHREGVLQYRWVWSRSNPQPTARVVKHDGVRAALPPGTPEITPAERRRILRNRRRHVDLREPLI
jgi:hypothetical protein